MKKKRGRPRIKRAVIVGIDKYQGQNSEIDQILKMYSGEAFCNDNF